MADLKLSHRQVIKKKMFGTTLSYKKLKVSVAQGNGFIF